MLGLNVKVFPMPLSKQPALLIDVIKRPSIFVQECRVCFFSPGLFIFYLFIFLSPKPLQKRLKSITAFKRKPHTTVFSIFKDFMVNLNIPQIYKGNNSIYSKIKIKKKSDLEAFHMIKLMSSKSYLF